MNITFENLFDKQVLARGYDYYQSGYVSYVEKKADTYKATITGTRAYDVSVHVHKGICTEMSCTCPYGSRCKHEAALLYYLKNAAEEDLIECEDMAKLSDELDSIEKSKLLDFIKDYMEQDEDFATAVRTRFSMCFKQDFNMYEHKVDMILYQNSDSHGFISYEYTYEFSKAMQLFLYSIADLKETYPEIVFAVCRYVISFMPDLAIDDSNGTTYEIVESCCDIIHDLYDESNPALLDEIKKWLKQSLEDGELADYGLEEPLENLEENWIPINERIEKIHKKLESYRRNYHETDKLVSTLLMLLQTINADKAEILKEMKRCRYARPAMEYLLQDAREKGDINAYEELLLNAKTESESAVSKDYYSTLLVDLYVELHDNEKLKKELYYRIMTGTIDLEHYLIYKHMHTKEEWEKHSDVVIGCLRAKHVDLAPYLSEEDKKEELFTLLKQRDFTEMLQYESALGNAYQAEIIAYYKDQCYKEAQHASNESYQRVYEILKHLHDMDNTKALVKNILRDFRQQYGRRTNLWKLLNTLDKV